MAAEVVKYTTGERMLRVICWLLILTGPAIVVRESLSSARQRSNVKRTWSDMRRIASAWEARATDLRRYNAAGASSFAIPGGLTFSHRINGQELTSMLVPKYIADLPTRDAWGNDFEFWVDQSGESYAIRSAGADGRFEPLTREPCPNWNCDIVYSNGELVNRLVPLK